MSTEEDIKLKVIMPFLNSLGFDENELEFEKSFSIRVGRHTSIVNDRIQTKRARLDILIKRDGNNLFVIEAKTDGRPLTEEDRDQAISYARLVDPMAPIVVVTNGKETKLYRTGDKKEIDKEIDKDKTNILNYQLGNDIENIYEEAFEYFIGYSFDNLNIFCSAQIKDKMVTLLGSREKPGRKFIPEMYVMPSGLLKAFNDFMSCEKNVFAVIGESGSGKTCSMCGLSLHLATEYPVLFYRAAELSKRLTESIAEDFNWEFSSTNDAIAIFKRLDRILKNKREMLIFVDGIDEWNFPNKVAIFGDFARHIRGKGFKLIVSCKVGYWERFLWDSGIPTRFSEQISPSNGYLMGPFQDREYSELINKYRSFYDFHGLFEKDVLDECKRQPFLLRVFFEVAKRTQSRHLTFSIKEFYDEYLKIVIERIQDPQRESALETIKAVAEVLFNRKTDTVDMGLLKTELGLPHHIGLDPKLFQYNILEKTGDLFESQVGFYFQKLRDYIIAFGVRKWDKTTLEEFKNEVELMGLESLPYESLIIFYQFAEEQKKRIIDGPVYKNAKDYVMLYRDVLDKHFVQFKRKFPPYSNGPIGFVGYLNVVDKTIGAFGFRPIKPEDELIKLIPAGMGSSFFPDDNRLYLLGADNESYRASFNGFKKIQLEREVLRGEIGNQLEIIIGKGLLNENNNYYLSLEKALGVIVANQRNLHNIRDDGKFSMYLPIDIETVEYGLRYNRASQIFSDRIFHEKGTRQGTTTHYSITKEDREQIHKLSHEAAINRILPQSNVHYIDLDKIEEHLSEVLSVLKRRNHVIDEAILPDEDSYGPFWPEDFYNTENLESVIFRLMSLYLSEYKTLIEFNFPTLKQFFQLYSQMPVRLFVLLHHKNNFKNSRASLHSFLCVDKTEGENEVTLCNSDETYFDHKAFVLHWRNTKFQIKEASGRSLIFNNPLFPLRIPEKFSILRSIIYDRVSKEIPFVLKELFNQYGLSDKP